MKEQPRGRKPQRGGSGGSSSSRSGAGRSGSDRRAGRTGERRNDRSGGRREWSRERPGGRGDDRRRDEPRTQEQKAYDGPPIPEEITGKELDRAVSAQLKSLPEKLALRVARHLVAAGHLLDSDPEQGYQHTLAARSRASRLAVVREAVGEAAYAAGHFPEALSELKAAKRMNGAIDYAALIADCERALGRPQRALDVIHQTPKQKLAPALLAELTIVEAGARLDRGEYDAALRALELLRLDSTSREPWVARVRYAYADALAGAGRRADALEWFHRTDAADSHGVTDASERAGELERLIEAEGS